MNKSQLKELFISYVNGFVSLAGFASYYGLNEATAQRIISLGRKLWDRDIKVIKG